VPITVDSLVFASADGLGRDANETVVVRGSEVDTIRVALERAVARWWLVDGLGWEHTPSDTGWQLREGLAGHSCQYDSGVRNEPDGLTVTIDCRGLIPPAMAATYLRILVEELSAGGVSDVSVRAPAASTDASPAPPVLAWRASNPPGFPADILIPDSLIVLRVADTRFERTRFADRQGYWAAEVAVADDRSPDAALDAYEGLVVAAGYETVARDVYRARGYKVLSVLCRRDPIDVEIRAAELAVAKRALPQLGPVSGRSCVFFTAYQPSPD
jgi:hypothetical protein